MHTKQKKAKGISGAVSLVTILILAGILFEIVLVGVVTSFLAGEKNIGMRSYHNALFAAQSGINDAHIRIIRNREFVPNPNPYTLTLQNGSASISITRTTLDATHIQYVVASTGSSGLKRIKITTVVIVDDITGSGTTQSMHESGI